VLDRIKSNPNENKNLTNNEKTAKLHDINYMLANSQKDITNADNRMIYKGFTSLNPN
jgi:hypothetical protein